MSEFKGLEGEITFYEDDIRSLISIGENRHIVDVWSFDLTKEEHNELTKTITEALKIRQEINFDLVELLRQRNEMLEMLKDIYSKFENDGHLLNVSPSKIQELIKQGTEI